jgi:hypothetical protein
MPIPRIIMMHMMLVIPSAVPGVVIVIIPIVVIPVSINDLDARKPNRHDWRTRSPNLATASKHPNRHHTPKTPKTNAEPFCFHEIPFVNQRTDLKPYVLNLSMDKIFAAAAFPTGPAVATPRSLG